ncbi:hypothetical protein DPV78_001171 [Talaromyces pinophilus]|nr:hypothetical protein DPV78_001171 [Talaromyces pinophilus]
MFVFKDDDVLEALLVKDFIGVQAVPQRELVLILESPRGFCFTCDFYSWFALFAASLEMPKRQDGTIRDLTILGTYSMLIGEKSPFAPLMLDSLSSRGISNFFGSEFLPSFIPLLQSKKRTTEV